MVLRGRDVGARSISRRTDVPPMQFVSLPDSVAVLALRASVSSQNKVPVSGGLGSRRARPNSRLMTKIANREFSRVK